MVKSKKDGVQSTAEAGLQEWLKGRLRFGKGDDTVIVFIPSHERDGQTRVKDQDQWAQKALDLMGRLFGGATGFPGLLGTWRDDENGGTMVDDEPIMIQSLAKREDIENEDVVAELAAFLKSMGKRTKQGAIGVVFNDGIHFITKYD